jgi:hypothetical protein
MPTYGKLKLINMRALNNITYMHTNRNNLHLLLQLFWDKKNAAKIQIYKLWHLIKNQIQSTSSAVNKTQSLSDKNLVIILVNMK